ncbi:MAG: hypothetical protein K2W82_03000 [Candidatus Obscuribacterales bacterium]|nr:hypothetical protein [Candidatus Obscuribacterales bacterium]
MNVWSIIGLEFEGVTLQVVLRVRTFALVLLFAVNVNVVFAAADPTMINGNGVNTQAQPQPILRTGINLNGKGVSDNSRQLAEEIGLLPLLEKIQNLRTKTSATVADKQEMLETIVQAQGLIQQTGLEVDYTLAQIAVEQNLYSEVLNTYQTDRDKAVARSNGASFYSNGALWAVTEALAIPSSRNAKYAVPSGIVGILAGVVPSVLSLYAMHQFIGKREDSDFDPNMLTKIFGCPAGPEEEYPASVWTFLNSVPTDDSTGKTRKDQLIMRWIRDQNIPTFTGLKSKKQIELITATATHRKGLSIDVLTLRIVMLQQLGAEIMRIKSYLLELSMVVSGNKKI